MKYLMIFLVVGFMSCKSNSQKTKTAQTQANTEVNDTNTEVNETSFVNTKGEKIEKIEKTAE